MANCGGRTGQGAPRTRIWEISPSLEGVGTPAHSRRMARFLKIVAVALLAAGPAWMATPSGACDPLASGAASVTGATSKDTAGRAVALININGQGPFRFILDTGANRSVLSQALATRLGLSPSGVGVVHSVDGAELAMLVNVESLSFGDSSPLGRGNARARRPHAGRRARAARRGRYGGAPAARRLHKKLCGDLRRRRTDVDERLVERARAHAFRFDW